MPRRPNLDRPTRLELKLPESVRARLDLLLFSELEGRVPLGAYQEFFLARLREHFDSRRLDLAPYLNCEPGLHIITASPQTVTRLEQALQIATLPACSE